MNYSPQADRPQMTWRQVTDASGRTRMEATWAVASEAAAALTPAAHAA